MPAGDDLRRSLERLVALGKTPDVNIRPVLLRVVVDLFVRKPNHAPTEIVQFEEIALKLFEEADYEARLIVADKLARYPGTPRSLIERFLAEHGFIASSVLEHAAIDVDVQLGAATLGTPEMAAAVARRSDLDSAVCMAIAERPESSVLLALTKNHSARIDRQAFNYLVRRARGDETLGLGLLERNAHPLDLAPLFLLATSEQRGTIIAAARREDLGPEARRPRLSPEQTAALARVERAILSPDRDNFDAALATALQIPLADVWRIIDDSRGEPLALALTAIGASPELAARVFILSGPAIGHSVMAVRNLTNVVESLPMRTASRLVAAMAGSPGRPLSRPAPEPGPSSRRRTETDGASARPVQAEPGPVDLRRRASGLR